MKYLKLFESNDVKYDIIQPLDKIGFVLKNGPSHRNCFDVYDIERDQIQGLYSIYGYLYRRNGDRAFIYNRPLVNISRHDDQYPKTPLDKWIEKEWEDICVKKGIRFAYTRYQTTFNPKRMDVPKFFKHLLDNQDSYYFSQKPPEL